jgi:hypothetical protein
MFLTTSLCHTLVHNVSEEVTFPFCSFTFNPYSICHVAGMIRDGITPVVSVTIMERCGIVCSCNIL